MRAFPWQLDRLRRTLSHFRKRRPPKWHRVNRNKYPYKEWRESVPIDEVPVCVCTDTCGDGCLNRELYQECAPGHCPTAAPLSPKKRSRREQWADILSCVSQNPLRAARATRTAVGRTSKSPTALSNSGNATVAQPVAGSGAEAASSQNTTAQRNVSGTVSSEAAKAQDTTSPSDESAAGSSKRKLPFPEKAYCANTRIQRKAFPEIEVFRTLNRGWGLRSTCRLPAGTMVCEYVHFNKCTCCGCAAGAE